MNRLVLAFAALLLSAAPARAESSWLCLPGIKAPISIQNGDVACAAKNGRDCLWDACPGKNAAAQPWTAPKDLKPLVCGADHKSKHGSDGYGQADHWCAQACALSGECSAGWRCLPGIKTPIRHANGNIECAAENGKDCLWDSCPGTNPAPTPWKPPAALSPLVCGADHQTKHGSDGYSQADHWCAQACAATGQCGAVWKCLPGIKSPLRFASGNVQCASNNGKDCLWDSCPGSNTVATAWTGAASKPLACGADHKAKHGMDGYGKADHWCHQACATWHCGK